MQRDQITARLTETLSRSPRATSVSVPVEWIRVLVGANEAAEQPSEAPETEATKPKSTRSRKTAKPAE